MSELSRESPHHVSGNYAIEDLVAGLRWVHDNIAKFGGDPGNVTIFGHSAGALDVGGLMTTPLAKGLFHRAIAESGPMVGRGVPPLAESEKTGVRLAEKVNAPAEGALRHLRSLPAKVLMENARGVVLSYFNVDGYVLPASPEAAYAAGKSHRVPFIIGSNAIEFSGPEPPDALKRSIEERYGALAPRALALYTAADPLYGSPGQQWSADTGFRCASRYQGQFHSDAGNPVWQYQFDRAMPGRPATSHGAEVGYVFANMRPRGNQGQYEEVDRKLSDTMQQYWINFARTGDPNGGSLPVWPKYDAKTNKYLEITTAAGVRVSENQRGSFCAVFLESLSAARRLITP